MKNKPTISIIIPTFNRSYLITRAVKSIISQSINSIELIIVDDGSQDETETIIKKLTSQYKLLSLKYIRQDHMGVALSINNGIKASIGKYITLLGSDDEYLSNHLELRTELMHRKPDLDLIHGGVKIIGNPWVVDKDDSKKLIHLQNCIIGGTLFGRRNVFIESGGFNNLAYSAESDFIERVSLKYKIAKVNFPTYIYHRDAPDSITNTYRNNFTEAVY